MRRKKITTPPSSFFHAHAHSNRSALDGMAQVQDMVERAEKYNQPALALTDHGNMSGSIQLYKHTKKAGLAAFPGIEAYLVHDLEDKKADRFHVGLLALNLKGYQAIGKLSSMSFTLGHFHMKPRISLDELWDFGDEHGKNVALTTGCYFGLVIQTLLNHGRPAATTILRTMANHYSNMYVELQNHNTRHTDHAVTDKLINADLWDIASALSLPVVITNDSHYCNVPSAPIWMADMTFKNLGDVLVGDKVVGWEQGEGRSRNLVESMVLSVVSRQAEVVKVTMESGRVIRCTPDHKWATQNGFRYTYYRGNGEYAPATQGSYLVQMIESVPSPESEGDMRWLGGMYDGEGSGTWIAQSLTHNPNICSEIERVLTENGFDYSVRDNGQGCNLYNIRGSRQAYVNFLNMALPVRSENFVAKIIGKRATPLGFDKVVSIEPDGRSEVISMQTTTGNYVAWGYASKNCDHGDKPAHDLMKKIVMQSKADDTDIIFPGDDYSLCSTEYLQGKFPQKIIDTSEDAFEDMLSKNTLKMPALDKYKFNVPETLALDPNKSLKKLVDKGLFDKHLDSWTHYHTRIKYELDIIKEMGMANYFLAVADYVAFCNKKGILVNARGSANGSLICYLIGITQIDAVAWDISFDRFLHPSRKKPPDIDLDVERDRRSEVIEYIGSKHDVTPIGTFGTLSDTDDRGSIFVKYLAHKRRIMSPEQYARTYGNMQSLWDLKNTDPADSVVLRQLADMRVHTGGGTHAAGYIVATDAQPLADYIPTMLVGGQKGNTVTQMTMDDVEDAGYMKIDLLGLAHLTTMRRCMDYLGMATMEEIPYNDKEAMKLLRSKKTVGVFQYEGYSTLLGANEMGVKSTKDAIYCLALYRPASMKGGHTDKYIARRRKEEKATYLHPVFEKATKDTYGVFILQDQVIDVLRTLGMSHEDLNDMLKAVKSSNHAVAAAQETFARIQPRFLKLCVAAGMDAKTSRLAWEEILGFSDYGFNKAHATAYGLLACREAYLKAHHPIEFMCATLETWAGTPKEAEYAKECRVMGVKMMKPDVSYSGINWTIDAKRNGIRKGLLSVTGVGWRSAEELVANQPYTSLEDLIERCNGGPGFVTGGKSWKKDGTLNGVLGHLQAAGALRSLISE